MVAKHLEERAKKLVTSAFPDAKHYELRVSSTNNSRFQKVDLVNKAGVTFPVYFFLVDMDEEQVFFGDPHLHLPKMVALADIGAAIRVGEQ